MMSPVICRPSCGRQKCVRRRPLKRIFVKFSRYDHIRPPGCWRQLLQAYSVPRTPFCTRQDRGQQTLYYICSATLCHQTSTVLRRPGLSWPFTLLLGCYPLFWGNLAGLSVRVVDSVSWEVVQTANPVSVGLSGRRHICQCFRCAWRRTASTKSLVQHT
jgi:hypothetical protein